eukprot:gene5842-6083_t
MEGCHDSSTPPQLCPVDGRSSSMRTHPNRSRRSRQMKRSRSAPDCKHGIASKIKIGLCAMDKKAQSKPMCEIIARLTAGGEFEIVNFGDQVILDQPVEEWPLCDVMLSWHSEGFPLWKAQQYVKLRRPFLINDVYMQDALLDRRRVYKILMDNNIPVPRHILVNREPSVTDGAVAAVSSSDPAAAVNGGGGPFALWLPDPPGFVEGEDYVELDGLRIDKPFVEKPVSGEDHNVYIYYPHSMGGGVKRLFRKVDNKSADYDPHHPGTVRRDGSYIYEEFLTTGGTDVKCVVLPPIAWRNIVLVLSTAQWEYSLYAHAEARKSPVVDGKVNRTADGKEVRFPVLLSPQEKEIARMVCLSFGQRVCGFDLLRSETGRSFVCDVNGWSFVKNSKKYYDDAAGILRSIILSQLAPQRLSLVPDTPHVIPLAELLEEATAAAPSGSVGSQPMSAAAAAEPGLDDGASSEEDYDECGADAAGGGSALREAVSFQYGGVLTHAGRGQAEDLGKMFRMVMYPRYGPAGGGLLRLHSTYRHDMKIYSSDEGRVQMSAAAFIQGLLDLEGSSLTPILVSLVTKNASMLDAFGKGASDDILSAKSTLYQHLTWDPDKATSLCSRLNLPLATPKNISPPASPLASGAGAVGAGADGEQVLVDELREKCLEERVESSSTPAAATPAAGQAAVPASGDKGPSPNSSSYSSLTTSPDDWRLDQTKPCSGERLLLMFDRWRKLLKSFFNEKKCQFDISKVPDIYDSAKYDAIHNAHLQLSPLKELYAISRQLAAVVVPHEYGLDGPGKLHIGSKICGELLGKLLCDLESMKSLMGNTYDAFDAEFGQDTLDASLSDGLGPTRCPQHTDQ